MHWPTVSILIPCTPGRSAERTVASTRCQEFAAPVQIVLCGESIAEINAATKSLQGDILSVIPCGDFYLPGALVRSLKALVREPALRLVSGCEVHLQADETTLRASPLTDDLIDPRSLMLSRPVARQCAFFWRRAFESVDGFRPGAADPATDLHYRLLHDGGGRFISHHTAVHQLDRSPRTAFDRQWLAGMRFTIDSCEADDVYFQRFQLKPADKLNLLRRWLLLEARQSGNEARSSELLAELMSGSDADTRAFLVRHGFLPMPSVTPAVDANHLRDLVDWSLGAVAEQRRVA